MKRLLAFVLAGVFGATLLTATTGCPSGDKDKKPAATDKDKAAPAPDKDKDKKPG